MFLKRVKSEPWSSMVKKQYRTNKRMEKKELVDNDKRINLLMKIENTSVRAQGG